MRRRFMNISNSVPLSFEALEDGLSISFSSEISYCINGGAWETLLAGEKTEEVNKGSVISFQHSKFLGSSGVGTFSINKKCNVYGTCSSIIPKLFGEKHMVPRLFYRLFYNCDAIVDASKLELPATTLAEGCYYSLFEGCTSLVNAPALPATTLAVSCYVDVFRDCSKLNYIKMLATDISASNCLSSWVYGVASSGTFVKNPAMTSLPTGHSGIPEGWTVVNDGEQSGGNLITFTIEGTEYQAEEGMTWEEWVNSEYNINMTFGIDEFDGTSITNGAKYVGTLTDYVKPSDLIIANYEYLLTW